MREGRKQIDQVWAHSQSGFSVCNNVCATDTSITGALIPGTQRRRPGNARRNRLSHQKSWMCSERFLILGPIEMCQFELFGRATEHWKRAHPHVHALAPAISDESNRAPEAPALRQHSPKLPALQKKAQRERQLRECKACGARMRETKFAGHQRRCPRRARKQPSSPRPERSSQRVARRLSGSTIQAQETAASRAIPIPQGSGVAMTSSLPTTTLQNFPFELLPPGTWEIGHVLAYYQRFANRLRCHTGEKRFQYERLLALNSLKPEHCLIGRCGWNGYVVFEFSWSKRVVLECLFEGNATYILAADWRELVGHTKLDLRRNYSASCSWIVHKGDWLQRVRRALGA